MAIPGYREDVFEDVQENLARMFDFAIPDADGGLATGDAAGDGAQATSTVHRQQP